MATKRPVKGPITVHESSHPQFYKRSDDTSIVKHYISLHKLNCTLHLHVQ